MSPKGSPSAARYAREVEEFRKHKDEFFATSPQSPIPQSARVAGFAGLKYYPPDLTYRLEAQCVPFDTPDIVPLGTTQGEIRRYVRYAELRFTVIGEDCRLTAFKNADDPGTTELFIPFRDATSGGETYGAGRYVEAEEDQSSEPGVAHPLIVDFNLAYSPWCACSDAYSCTLPPAENRLAIPIMAGELLYPIDH